MDVSLRPYLGSGQSLFKILRRQGKRIEESGGNEAGS